MGLIKCKECGSEISKKADKCPNCGAPITKSVSLWTIIKLGIFVWFCYIVINGVINIDTSKETMVDKEKMALNKIEFDFSWSKSGFDNIMIANFVIKNNYSKPVKDIAITCSHSADSGTVIDSNTRVLYQIIPSGKSITVEGFNMGFIHPQAKKSGCSISGLRV